MAIYNNREVSVVAPTRPVVFPEQVTVVYRDGSHENVPLASIKYTQDEKSRLIKNYPSIFDSVSTISEDDLKAVRLGIAPPSDPTYQVQAEAQVRTQKQQEENSKHLEKAKAEASKKVNAEVKGKPFQLTPQSPTSQYQVEGKK